MDDINFVHLTLNTAASKSQINKMKMITVQQ